MSDTEVTVDRSTSGTWWRMAYRGRSDFMEKEPTPEQCAAFRASVDAAIKRKRAEAQIRPSGRDTISVQPAVQHGRARP